LTYQQFVAGHRAPPASEVALAAGLQVEKIQVAWRRLHDMHDLVLNPATLELRMANPFSAVPTAYRVNAPAAVLRDLCVGRILHLWCDSRWH